MAGTASAVEIVVVVAAAAVVVSGRIRIIRMVMATEITSSRTRGDSRTGAVAAADGIDLAAVAAKVVM